MLPTTCDLSVFNNMTCKFLPVEPLTSSAFEPFGDVIQTAGRSFHHINARKVERYHDLAAVDVDEQEGRAGISLLRAQPYELPLKVTYVERHPMSSQAFIPLSDRPFLVIVAPAWESVRPSDLRAFLTDGSQGINYRRAVWHHVLLAIGVPDTFIAIDRIGSGPNCDRFDIPEREQLTIDVVLLDALGKAPLGGAAKRS